MNLLLTGANKYSGEQIRELARIGFEITFVQDERIPLKEQGVDPSIIDAVVCNALFLHNDIDEFTNLKLIQLTSAGLDRVPLEKIKERGIDIYNARGVYSIPMAEFALCGVLQLYKKSGSFSASQNSKEWKKEREIKELFGKNVCVVGCGSVGTECAKRFIAFGCNVTGVDIVPRENEFYSEMVSLEVLDKVLGKSDVVVLTLPLTTDTRNLFDKKMFEKMKKGAVLVNIARGAIVSESALINTLKDKLFGAVLDVFEQEPLSDESPLWSMDNVILTPHNSFVGEGNSERLFNVIYENLKRK